MHILAPLFFVSLLSTLALTPLAAKIGRAFGAIDQPGMRKIHSTARPRTGGIALFTAFALLLVLAHFTPLFEPWFEIDRDFFLIMSGLSLAFMTGLIDDFVHLHCLVKLGLQIASATLAFAGGLHIDHFYLGSLQIDFSPLASFVLTQFWFLLFINAVNLIDGLDGLAVGILVFASAVMALLLAIRGDTLGAAWFTIIAGNCLGFLYYNFSPAKIFLGDGGSYFLGYCMAAFSIMAGFKSHLGAAFLIPVVGMGIPVFDTILAPIRRFFSGKAIFRPDEDHIHHRLLKKGLSTKRVVLILYGLTGLLCFFSLFLAQMRDPRAGLLLLGPGIGAVVLMKRLDYFDSLSTESFSNWIKDMSYFTGLHKDRRSFLDLQAKISSSKSLEELWTHIAAALDLFGFDLGRMVLNNGFHNGQEKSAAYEWSRKDEKFETLLMQEHMLKLELPFVQQEMDHLGTLWLLKDLRQDMMSHYTLQRVEHLRRSVSKALFNMERDNRMRNSEEGGGCSR